MALVNAEFEKLPSSLYMLPNLLGIHISAPNMRAINAQLPNSWPQLQVLDCSPCPALNAHVFEKADFSRLTRLKVEGVSYCDANQYGMKGQLESFSCTTATESSTCDAVPNWLLEHFAARVKHTTSTDCHAEACDYFLDAFAASDSIFDGNPDALLDAQEIAHYVKEFAGYPGLEDIPLAAFLCRTTYSYEQRKQDNVYLQKQLHNSLHGREHTIDY